MGRDAVVMDDPLQIAALGRPLHLGMLYDARRDSFIPGITLWDKDRLDKDRDVKPQPNTEFQLISSDSLQEKSCALDVSASLEISFLAGLVAVGGGSAKYLNDSASSQLQSRVTLKYRSTTRFEQLTMSQLGQVTHAQVFEQKMATHVVTAVLYGADALFVFDRTVSKQEDRSEIEGRLSAMINKIPSLSAHAGAYLEMTDADKKIVEKLNCRFYGDFDIQRNPTTYREAIQVYRMLPSLLGEKREKVIPITVWLLPLKLLDPKAAGLVREISVRLVSEAEAVLEKIDDIRRRVQDLMNDNAAADFADLHQKLDQFKHLFQQHRLAYQKDLCRVLPAVRGGEQDEGALVDILKEIEVSPFSADRAAEWLDDKEYELTLLRSYTGELKHIPIMASKRKLNEVLLDRNIDNVVCFTFTSLGNVEPYILALTQYLQRKDFDSPENPSASVLGASEEETQSRFTSQDLLAAIGEKHRLFTGFAEANRSNTKTKFIFASIPDPDCPGASIRWYRRGRLVSAQFQLASKPSAPVPTDSQPDSVSLELPPPPQTGEIEAYRVERREVQGSAVTRRTEAEEQWVVTDTSQRQETCTLFGLQPGKRYEVRCRAVTAVGVSEASEAIDVQTEPNPRAAPERPSVKRLADSSVRVSWTTPVATVDGETPQQYKVEYKDERWAAWGAQLTEGPEESCVFVGLSFLKTHRFRVYAVFAEGDASAASEEVDLQNDGRSPTLDTNSAHNQLEISSDLRTVTLTRDSQGRPNHAHRFDGWNTQALSSDSYSSSQHYWEVDVAAARRCRIGVAYGSISRRGGGAESRLGDNDVSWIVEKSGDTWSVHHAGVRTPVSAPGFPRRVGVHLDWDAGRLSFYSAESVTLLHSFHQTFTQPLYPALWVGGWFDDSITIVNLSPAS